MRSPSAGIRRNVHSLTLVAVFALTFCAGCRTADPLPSPPPSMNVMPNDLLPAHPISLDEVTALRPGMSMQQVVDLLGNPTLVGSIPAMMYEAQAGGEYYLLFCDLRSLSPATPTGLQAVVHIPTKGEAVYVLPREKSGQTPHWVLLPEAVGAPDAGK